MNHRVSKAASVYQPPNALTKHIRRADSKDQKVQTENTFRTVRKARPGLSQATDPPPNDNWNGVGRGDKIEDLNKVSGSSEMGTQLAAKRRRPVQNEQPRTEQ
jgi:hypothetical protein